MKKLTRLGTIFGLMVALGACVSPLDVTFTDATDKALDETIFSAESGGMKGLRSGYILGAVGLYGVHAVKTYSGPQSEDDARLILARFKQMVKRLDERVGRDTNPQFWYVDYVVDTFRFTKVAVEPTKRYYRERLLQHIVDSNPIAGAKTALEAVKNLAKVTLYRGAITRDAKDVAGNDPKRTVSQDDWKGANELFFVACTRLKKLADDSDTDCANVKVTL